MILHRNPIVQTVYVPNGSSGTKATLQLMSRLARRATTIPAFVVFAQNLQLLGGDTEAINEFLAKYYDYTDEEIETLYAPEYNMIHLLDKRKLIGDCDDISMFYAAVFKTLGYRVRFVAMKTKRNDPEYRHVVAEVLEDGRWKRYDPTVGANVTQIDYGQMVEYV